jgi:hypothetical protein
MYNTDMPRRAELPSKAQLLRSTAIAIVTAGVLLTTVVLPSEYGIDPTGIGSALNLTEMGKIKTALAADALADAAAAERKPQATAPAAQARPALAGKRSDEMQVTLQPREGIEVKMAMLKGATVHYEWKTDGGLVNHDTHGEPDNAPPNTFHRYKKEKDVTGNSGEFSAAFDGHHGWFWRNRGDKPVTITLKTGGVYSDIRKIM